MGGIRGDAALSVNHLRTLAGATAECALATDDCAICEDLSGIWLPATPVYTSDGILVPSTPRLGPGLGDVDATLEKCCSALVPSILRLKTAAVVVFLVSSWILWQKADSKESVQSVHESANDDTLRSFLGIRTLRGPFKLPASSKGYYSVVLIFENGEEVGRAVGPMVGFGALPEGLSGELQLLMSAKDRRASLFSPGNSTELGERFNWAQFSGSMAWGSIPVDRELRYKDVSVRGVLAIAAPGSKISPSIRQDEKFPMSGDNVVAIGVVSGDDFDVLSAKFESESAYRPPNRSKSETKPN